jgi:DNA processing protein
MSGLARGVDSASYRGTISAKGKTVAVFGTGVDLIYPQENSPLSEQILALGSALISEFPLGTFAPLQNFPIANRIIGKMSVGVVVDEAAEYPPRASPPAVRSNKIATCLRCPATSPNQDSWEPNTLIQPGAVRWRPGKRYGKNVQQNDDLV